MVTIGNFEVNWHYLSLATLPSLPCSCQCLRSSNENQSINQYVAYEQALHLEESRGVMRAREESCEMVRSLTVRSALHTWRTC